MTLKHRTLNQKECGFDFTHTPLVELTNGRIRVLVHPDSGRVVQIFSPHGTAHLVSTPAMLGKDFRAYGIGEIRYSCDVRGWGYEDRWYPLNLEIAGWTHEIEQSPDALSVKMLSHPKPDSWNEVVAIVERTVTIEKDSDSVVVRTRWKNPLSCRVANFYSVWVGASPGIFWSETGWPGQHHYEHLLAADHRGRVRQYSYWDLAGGGHSLCSRDFLAYDTVDQEGLRIESDVDDVEGYAAPGTNRPLFGLAFHACRSLPRWGEAEMALRLTPVSGPLKSLGKPFAAWRPPSYPRSLNDQAAELSGHLAQARAESRIEEEEAALVAGQLKRADWWKKTRDKHGFERCAEILNTAAELLKACENGSKVVSQLASPDQVEKKRRNRADSGKLPTSADIEAHLDWFDKNPPLRVGAQPWGYMHHSIEAIDKALLLNDGPRMRQAYEKYRDNAFALLEKYGSTTLSTVHAVYVGNWFEACYEKLVRMNLLTFPERVQAWAAYLETVDWMLEAGGSALKTNWGWAERGLLAEAILRLPFHPHAALWRKLVQELIDENLRGQCDGDGAPFEPISYIGNATSAAVMLDLRMKGRRPDQPLSPDYGGGNLCRSYEFFFRASGPDGLVTAIGDGHATQAAPYLAEGARLFARGDWAMAARDFGHQPPAEEPSLPPSPPEQNYHRGNDLLRHFGMAVLRCGPTQLSFWFGKLESHQHVDELSFDLWAQGEHLSRDPGVTKDGYSSYANVYWVSQPRSHNCVTLNDESYTAPVRPELRTWEDRGPGAVEFAAASQVYADTTCRVTLERKVKQQGLVFTFMDTFAGNLPGWAKEMIWRFNSAAKPEVTAGTAIIQGQHATVRINPPDPDARIEVLDVPYASSNGAPWQVRVIRPLAGTASLTTKVEVIPR